MAHKYSHFNWAKWRLCVNSMMPTALWPWYKFENLKICPVNQPQAMIQMPTKSIIYSINHRANNSIYYCIIIFLVVIQFSINACNNMLCVVNVNQKKTKQNRKYQPKKKQNTRQITKNGTKMLMLDLFFKKKMHIEMFNL